MAVPLAPIAGIALRYGAVALATYAATRAIPKMRRNQHTEDVMDTVEEGIEMRRDKQDNSTQVNASARLKRTVFVKKSGPRLEIDAAALARVRLRWIR